MMDFINTELRESVLFRTDTAISRRTAEDIKNICFLSFLTLSILSQEFSTAPWAQDYLGKTFRYGTNFATVRRTDTDLYWALHILETKAAKKLDPKEADENVTELDRITLPKPMLKAWATKAIKGSVTDGDTGRFLLRIETDLRITNSDYKSLRRLISNWSNLSDNQRSVACTRLGYALRKHMRLSELYPEFDKFTKEKKYLLKDTIDPENPKSTTVNKDLEALALGTITGLVGTALMIGHGMSKDADLRSQFRSYYKNLSEDTTSGNIASIAMPMNIGTIKRYPKRKDRKSK